MHQFPMTCRLTAMLRRQRPGPGLAPLAGLSSLARAAHHKSKPLVVDGDTIRPMATPSQFYETLVGAIGSARSSVSISSLYIGTGEHERRLLSAASSCVAPVHAVMDATRGRRPHPSPSPEEFFTAQLGEGSVRLLDHPAAGWLPRRYFGKGRLREGGGTHHAKVYAADDWACVSGANLSEEYFCGRQDRYLEMRHAGLAGLYHGVVGMLVASPGRGAVLAGEERARLREGMGDLLAEATAHGVPAAGDGGVPVSLAWQCGVLGLRDDEERVLSVLAATGAGASVDIATGYCNMPDFVVDALAAAAARGAAVRVLTASPAANGFLGARGIPAALPLGYSFLLRRIARRLRQAGVLREPAAGDPSTAGVAGRVLLVEWTHPNDHGWALPREGPAGVGMEPPDEASGPARRTFHAKGLWVTGDDGSVLTAAGSSNFGRRSFDIDLELQTWVGPVPAGSATAEALEGERAALFDGEAAVPVGLRQLESRERSVGPTLWAKDTGLWVEAAAVVLRPWM